MFLLEAAAGELQARLRRITAKPPKADKIITAPGGIGIGAISFKTVTLNPDAVPKVPSPKFNPGSLNDSKTAFPSAAAKVPPAETLVKIISNGDGPKFAF